MTTGRAETIQAQAAARLKARMTDFEVREFPEALERFDWKADRTLLVSFGDGTYTSEAQSLAPPSVERARELHVTLLLRTLNGPQGAERTIDRIVEHIFGWRPVGGGNVFLPVRDGFQEEKDGTWRFVVVFTQTKTLVAFENENDLFPAPMQETDTTAERDHA